MAIDLESAESQESAAAVVCANCSHTISLTGSQFCAHCGQSLQTFRLSVWRLLRDFMVETFEVDGRLARTVSKLFGRPGALSHAFSNNQRASFVSPVRMYLFSSLLFFFLLALDGGEKSPISNTDVAIETGSPSSAAGGEQRTNPEVLLPFLSEKEQVQLTALLAEPYRYVNHVVLGYLVDVYTEAATNDREPDWWLQRSLSNVVALLADPSGYYKAVLENLPIAMFVLLPFYALLLKLVFLSSRRYFAEHMVFALYLHIVAFLIFSLSIMLPSTSSGLWSVLQPILSIGALVYLGAYTFLAMRRYYPVEAVERQARDDTEMAESAIASASLWSIGWRFLLLGGCYVALLAPALLLVMAFSFIGL